MDVFLMIRRAKTTMFLDAKETTTVYEVKQMIEGILKKSPDDQRLFSKDLQTIMDDSKQISEYGYTNSTARAQLPEAIGLAYRTVINPSGDREKDEFEPLDITPVSTPPDLPDVMKSESSSSNAQGNADSTEK
jgi:elongin-B